MNISKVVKRLSTREITWGKVKPAFGTPAEAAAT
jgi:hypothetical protein